MTSNYSRMLRDPLLLPLLLASLLNALCAGVLWQKFAAACDLGPGWPELLQGLSGFLLLVLMLIRALWLKKRINPR
ncbi:hypothetical protein JR064_15010 [Xanthomonas sp. CFBP 8703]|uniref:Uncharacterized protein n=1 Tax=Xanthomonas bonasiae TaxID=2810351 RepID=A0ABS3B4P3_9XANT|nr:MULTISPECIES: hypothetical protein [Xanthomonas]MBN6103476.1 hypothetical protein [Xanthomonas bonasiae]MBN6114065.1 hypothetical protein [Xanthomonas bonasiae]NYF21642.1 hypothetical protein [Xanthomonas sp. JAI131]